MATLLSIEGIHKTFEGGTVNENHVLKGLDLQVEEGDFISVIGGNGAVFVSVRKILRVSSKILRWGQLPV